MTFDTHVAIKKLQAVGVPLEQAEVFVDLVRDNLTVDLSALATKADLKALELATRADMELLKRDLTIRLGGMIGGGVAFLALIKFFG